LDILAAADAAGGFASFDEALASAPAPVLDSAAFGAIADISFLPGGGFWAPLILGLVGSAVAELVSQQDDETGAIVRQIAKITDVVYIKLRTPLAATLGDVLPRP